MELKIKIEGKEGLGKEIKKMVRDHLKSMTRNVINEIVMNESQRIIDSIAEKLSNSESYHTRSAFDNACRRLVTDHEKKSIISSIKNDIKRDDLVYFGSRLNEKIDEHLKEINFEKLVTERSKNLLKGLFD